MNHTRFTAIIIALTGIAIIVFNLSATSPKRTAHNPVNQDAQRISDIDDLQSDVENYYDTNSVLPDALQEVTPSETENTRLGQYTYKILTGNVPVETPSTLPHPSVQPLATSNALPTSTSGNNHDSAAYLSTPTTASYELCTTFATDTTAGQTFSQSDYPSIHPRGYVCFTNTVSSD